MDYNDIEEENKMLKKKLENIKNWAKREILSQKEIINEDNLINKDKLINDKYCKIKSKNWSDDEEKEILDKIISFLWEDIILNLNYQIIENIVISEKSYENFQDTPSLDWLSVIASYNKAIDLIIEEYITKWFRGFVLAQKIKIYQNKSDKMEFFLYLVVKSWYIFSIWKLYNILKSIKTWERLNFLSLKFYNYIKSNTFLNEILLDDENFYLILDELVNSEVFWEKRHNWVIKFVETRRTRKLFLWDFFDKNCLLYKILSINKLEF